MMKPLRIGKVQLDIMNVIWEKGETTAREITDELCRQKAIAHSTVQTLLRNLEAKGAITHEKQDRTFTFKPLIHREDVQASSAHDLLTRVFQGSAYDLVSHLLKEERIEKDELLRLRELIENHAKEEQR